MEVDPGIRRAIALAERGVVPFRPALEHVCGERARHDARGPTDPAVRAWADRYGIDLDEFGPPLPPPSPDAFMTVTDAAALIGVDDDAVLALLDDGELAGLECGGAWQVWRESAELLRRELAEQASS